MIWLVTSKTPFEKCFARRDIVSIIIIRSSNICTIQRDTRTFCFVFHLSACNKGNRTRLPARGLFVPLMLNSAFDKTEQFFCVGIKSFLVYRIRRHTDIFRFILIGLIASFHKEERVRLRSNKLLKLECFQMLAKVKKWSRQCYL